MPDFEPMRVAAMLTYSAVLFPTVNICFIYTVIIIVVQLKTASLQVTAIVLCDLSWKWHLVDSGYYEKRP